MEEDEKKNYLALTRIVWNGGEDKTNQKITLKGEEEKAGRGRREKKKKSKLMGVMIDYRSYKSKVRSFT